MLTRFTRKNKNSQDFLVFLTNLVTFWSNIRCYYLSFITISICEIHYVKFYVANFLFKKYSAFYLKNLSCKNVTVKIYRTPYPAFHFMHSMTCMYTMYRFFPPHRVRDKFLANAKIVLSDNLDRVSYVIWPIFIRGSTL